MLNNRFDSLLDILKPFLHLTDITTTLYLQAAVHILNLVQEIIPAVADLNCQLFPPSVVPSPTAVAASSAADVTEANTTSQHYAVVQSDHPYKPATVSNYKVSLDIVYSVKL